MIKIFVVFMIISVVSGCGNQNVIAHDAAPADASSTTDAALTDSSATADTTIIVLDGGARALSGNDISILFPRGRGELWTAEVSGLTQALFAEINPTRFPALTTQVFPSAVADKYGAMRVVSIRMDPCTTGCAAQLRLVLQATLADGFSDGAVHVTHSLDAAQFSALRDRVRALQVLSPENADSVLKVNPSLQTQGMNGAYAGALRLRLADTISTNTISRVTFMTRTDSRSSSWEFGGLDLRAGVVQGRTAIADFVGAGFLQLNAPVGPQSYLIRRDNAGTTVPHPNAAFARAMNTEALMNASAADQQASYDAVVRRHNPSELSPDTADCISCHVASPIRNNTFWANRTSTLVYAQEARARRVSGSEDANRDNMRAFGYFDTAAVITRRVANDTDVALGGWR